MGRYIGLAEDRARLVLLGMAATDGLEEVLAEAGDHVRRADEPGAAIIR